MVQVPYNYQPYLDVLLTNTCNKRVTAELSPKSNTNNEITDIASGINN